jgi:acyl CoA:acetate/3-ketoacid CoA transferase alpha subunit
MTLVSNNDRTTDYGLGLLRLDKQRKKIIAYYVGENVGEMPIVKLK